MKEKKVKFTNENAKKIYSSIEKSRYIWRTLKGISKETNITVAQIQPKIE
ncbi:hypothetical protein [Clostridium beijerinckii]|nr:hypothetical protein [Clostridium beijerinckii]